MKVPPKLSPRERQILPSLTAGLTRFEIAEKLGLGPDSIKLTTGNLVRKFGFRTIRDAMISMQEYEVVYLRGDHGVFYDVLKMNFDVYDWSARATLDTSFAFTSLDYGVQEIRHQFIRFAEFKSVRCNGDSVEQQSIFADSRTFCFKLPRKMRRREQSNASVSIEFSAPKTTQLYNLLPIWIDEPTGIVDLVVTFHKDPIPTSFGLMARLAHHSELLDAQIDKLADNKFRVVVDDPKYLWRYFLVWDWT